MAAHRVFFLSRALISVSMVLCFGCLEWLLSRQKRFCTVNSCEAVTEKALESEVLHMLSEIHHDRENWVPQGVELHSFRKGQSQRRPWHWYDAHGALWPNNLSVRKRCVMGHMRDILTLKPWEFNDGHHELLLWRYVEVDGKEDPSDGWSSWINHIIYIFRLRATTLLRLPSSVWILEAWCLNMWYLQGISGQNTSREFLHVKKELCFMAIWNKTSCCTNKETMPQCSPPSMRPWM